ncbi:MAG: hypothetical protein ACTSUB_08350 [Candidatus Thorarchaeota archaeon]
MRELNIVTTKTHYRSGEIVDGYILVTCDKAFKYNAIHLTLKGVEQTRIAGSVGPHVPPHKQNYTHVHEHIVFEHRGSMEVGKKLHHFSFKLPEDAPSSYEGKCGRIGYTLSAQVEISWGIDTSTKTRIFVKQFKSELTAQKQQATVEKDGRPLLEVEIEKDAISVGNDIDFRFRVSSDVKIKRVKVELETEEKARAIASTNKDVRTLYETMISDDQITRDQWITMTINTEETMPTTFHKWLVTNSIYLKVTLDIPRGFDQSVRIPLTLDYCDTEVATVAISPLLS